MDPAGLAVGALPLAVLLFNQCVVAYKVFVEGRDLEKSASHLITQLLIEECRLGKWGSDVLLPNRTMESLGARLTPEHPNYELVTRVLECIKDLLEDIHVIKLRYGLQLLRMDETPEQDPGAKNSIAPAPSPTIRTTHRWSPYGTKQPQIASGDSSSMTRGANITAGATRAKTISRIKRCRWSVVDKDSFTNLVGQLRKYNDSLYAIFSPEVSLTISRDVLSALAGSPHAGQLQIRRLSEASTSASISHKSIPSKATWEQLPYDTVAASVAMSTCVGRLTPLGELDESLRIRVSELSGGYGCPFGGGRGNFSRFWLRKLLRNGRTTLALSETFEYASQQSDLPTECARIGTLVKILNNAGSSREFLTPKCLGLCEERDGRSDVALTIIFELPSEDQFVPSENQFGSSFISLAQLLKQAESHTEYAKHRTAVWVARHGASNIDAADESHEVPAERQTFTGLSGVPDLDERLGLAYKLARAIFNWHSAGVVHKRLEAGWIVFGAGSISSNYDGGTRHDHMSPVSLATPYVFGLQYARPSTFMSPRSDSDGLGPTFSYQHPFYTFHQAIRVLASDMSCHSPEIVALRQRLAKRNSFRYRHDYFSLGLVLLEIGLWQGEPWLDMAVQSQCLRKWAGVDDGMERLFSELTRFSFPQQGSTSKQPTTIFDDDEILAAMRDCFEFEGIKEFRLEHLGGHGLRDPSNRFWLEAQALLVRRRIWKQLIDLAESTLGKLMGRRYRDLTVRCLKGDFRCLKGDFSLLAEDDEAEWLHVFNWRVVLELDRCCKAL